MHTYSMRGCPRERYIFVIGMVAIAVIAIAKQAAGYIGVGISITSFTTFGVLYFAFDHWLWRLRYVKGFVAVPDLSGEWDAEGSTDGADGVARDWRGTVTIEQRWSHIAIAIETEGSRSRSRMAAIERDPGHGYRLIYAYENTPKQVSTSLTSHYGGCTVNFSQDLQTAQATYFNDHQRRTVGTMTWKRKPRNGA